MEVSMRKEQREQYYEEDEPQSQWRGTNPQYQNEEDFGSPHDQGESPARQHFRSGPER
jgi:hypothetical protein